ncbi:L,D-transpeptidase family protein [uncultured Sphingomonas sp.]|uniref:L,D-transpeptidase family protein n=1 Tax=uncultured Sphingomonas sp. TaxID=158754 RepID=UPI00262910D2|nr:L,D-transpeptidase family protein [uncultured Sphingomonas sp.]
MPLALAATAITIAAAVTRHHADQYVPDPPARQIEDGPRLWYPVGQYPQLSLPDGEHKAVKSVLNVRQTMHFGDYVWDDKHIPGGGEIWVRIDLRRQLLSVFRGGHEIGSAVILYGTDGKPTPTGVFPIMEKREEHRSSLYDAEMPYMLRLTGDGVAIHASNVRRGSATHGCIGVPPSFAALLFAAVKPGDTVAIMPPATKS